MTKQRTVGFLIGFLWITNGVANSGTRGAPNETACAIELARFKSPHSYLVAMVERNEPKCDVDDCQANLSVIKVISAGDISLRPTSIDVRYTVKARENGGQYPEGSSIAVFIPDSNSKVYRWLAVAFPAISTVIDNFEQAVEIAGASPTGTSHCEKSAASTGQWLHQTDQHLVW
jgi:hypothetical protein